jgi:hypothetical protein
MFEKNFLLFGHGVADSGGTTLCTDSNKKWRQIHAVERQEETRRGFTQINAGQK